MGWCLFWTVHLLENLAGEDNGVDLDFRRITGTSDPSADRRIEGLVCFHGIEFSVGFFFWSFKNFGPK